MRDLSMASAMPATTSSVDSDPDMDEALRRIRIGAGR
jgi:hypothetical protein